MFRRHGNRVERSQAAGPCGGMKYRFRATQRFGESFYALSPSQNDSTRRVWKILRRILLTLDCDLTTSTSYRPATAARSTRRRTKPLCEPYSTSKETWW